MKKVINNSSFNIMTLDELLIMLLDNQYCCICSTLDNINLTIVLSIVLFKIKQKNPERKLWDD